MRCQNCDRDGDGGCRTCQFFAAFSTGLTKEYEINSKTDEHDSSYKDRSLYKSIPLDVDFACRSRRARRTIIEAARWRLFQMDVGTIAVNMLVSVMTGVITGVAVGYFGFARP